MYMLYSISLQHAPYISIFTISLHISKSHDCIISLHYDLALPMGDIGFVAQSMCSNIMCVCDVFPLVIYCPELSYVPYGWWMPNQNNVTSWVHVECDENRTVVDPDYNSFYCQQSGEWSHNPHNTSQPQCRCELNVQ